MPSLAVPRSPWAEAADGVGRRHAISMLTGLMSGPIAMRCAAAVAGTLATSGTRVGWVVALVLAFGGAAAFTPLMRKVALRFGALSYPAEGHVHSKPTPYLGGVGIFGGFALGLGALLVLGGGLAASDRTKLLGVLIAGSVIVALGVLDDLGSRWAPRFPAFADADKRGMRPVVKVVGEVGAALILCATGVSIAGVHVPFSHDPCSWMAFGPWTAWPLTVIWVVAITNAVNLIDGLDGLAAGVSSISAGTLLVVALMAGWWPAALLAGVLLGSCLGFLPFNFHPARIFMGDAGALFLGFMLSAVSVVGPMKGPTVLTLAVPALALGLPVFDTVMAILRRWRSGRLMGTRDQAHIHHRLLALGLSHRDAVLALYVVSGWLGVSALAVESLTPQLGLAILVFVVISGALVARLVGVVGHRVRA